MYGSVQVWVCTRKHVSVPELSKFRYLTKFFSEINLDYSTILHFEHSTWQKGVCTTWTKRILMGPFTVQAVSHIYHSHIPRNSKVSKTDISTLQLLLHKTILCKQTLYHKTTFISYPLIMWLIQRIFTDRSIHIPKHSKKVWNGNISIKIQNYGNFRKTPSKM